MVRGAARSRHPFLDRDHPIPFAHRGGEVSGLENSMVAFQDAYDVGYRYLETDLHATADGVLVAFHDESLDRVTDGSGLICELPFEQVAKARIGGQEPIPRFDELLASFPDVYWNLDVKADPALAPLLERLAGDDDLLERTCIGAFSDARLVAVRTVLGERACTSAGPNEVRQLRATSLLGPLSQRLPIDADCVQIPTRYGRVPLVDRVLLSAARDQGLPVHVWTINDEAEMRRLLALGVDGIFTDATRTLRAVLEQRGEWVPPEHDPEGRTQR